MPRMKSSSKLTSLTFTRRVAVATAATFLALGLSAQPIKHADKNFIENAAKCGMEELAISRVVVERTTNPQVKSFAQMVVDDHSSANDALMSIASAKGVKLPAKDMDDAKKWSKKSAKGLDEDYVEKMVSAHKDAVKLFEKEADKGEDAETKAFARATLPKLQHHLEMAMDLKKTVK